MKNLQLVNQVADPIHLSCSVIQRLQRTMEIAMDSIWFIVEITMKPCLVIMWIPADL